MTDTARLQRSLGYEFNDPQLLELALTHRSVGGRNNERLEFLGDSILNHIVAEAIYQRYPNSPEGEMSRMRAALVKGDSLGMVAQELQLGDYLRLGPGEQKSGGHRRSSILADALEAILGAVLLDGDVESCRACVLGLFETRLQQFTSGSIEKDAKTRLQEFVQERNNPLPQYELVGIQGDDHAQQFRVVCRLRKPAIVAEGSGTSRRKAEQSAAGAAFDKLTAHGKQ